MTGAVLGLLIATTQQNSVIQQASTGWCSPNISNVSGNVTITCIGVDPRALKRLNVQLNLVKAALSEKIREANEWAERYHELAIQLANSAGDEQLRRSAADHLHAGELEQAGAVLDQILARDEKRSAADEYSRALVFQLQFRPLDALPHLAKAYQYRPESPKYGLAYGTLLARQNDYDGAERVLTATLNTANRLPNPGANINASEIPGTLYQLANIYRKTQRLAEAESAYEISIRTWRRLAKANPAANKPRLANALDSFGNFYSEAGHFAEAEAAYTEAVQIQQALAKSNPACYEPDLAQTFNNLGNLYANQGRLKQAQPAYQQAVGIRRHLAEVNPAAYRGDLAEALNNLATFEARMGRLVPAEDASAEALQIRRQLAKVNPAAYQPGLANTLNNLGNICMAAHAPGKAEELYRESLDLFQELARRAPKVYELQVGMSLANLANAYSDTAKLKEAEITYQKALEIVRPLAAVNPAYRSQLADTLSNVGDFHVRIQEFKQGDAAYQEAIGLYRKLSEADELAYGPRAARALERLARTKMKQDELADAESEASEAVEISSRLWRRDPAAFGDDFARQQVLAANVLALMGTDQPRMCALLRQAAQVASDSALKQLAVSKSVGCNL